MVIPTTTKLDTETMIYGIELSAQDLEPVCEDKFPIAVKIRLAPSKPEWDAIIRLLLRLML